MSMLFNRNTKQPQSSAKKSRRPAGISRRRRRQLGFETLEDRRVMSAESPLAALKGNVAENVSLQATSFSSNDLAGNLAILQNELYWQSLVGGSSASSSTPANLATRAVPTDPLLNLQWHLINTGQQVGNPDFQAIFGIPGEDINVAPVWNQGIFGTGVVVAVIDSGVQSSHPDLAANIGLQFDAITGDADANPNVADPANAHGTAVAGLIGAIANNGVGGTGVAPGVTLVPIRLIDGTPITNQQIVDAFRFSLDNGVDITNNSWGPGITTRGLGGISPQEILALRDTVLFGRDGLGIINLFASGNSAGADFDQGFPDGIFDTAAYDAYINTRYTIGVTGVDHDGFANNIDGTLTSYPEVSTAVLIAAPTGSIFFDIGDDTGIGSGIVTTDLVGNLGFNQDGTLLDPFRDFLEDTDFTSRFNGTSASTPIASGVVALMLEANPNLSWRDVQEILVRSARQNAEFDIPETVGLGSTQNTWIINQMPVFHDPDIFDPGVSPILQTLFPTLDPTLRAGFNGAHYAPTPIVLTNGAGFTVSQGVSPAAENIGYAHGVVDADLAVKLAQQWHTKNQALPAELTFTTFVTPTEGPDINISAAEKGNQDSGFQLVPGGIGGTVGGGFIDYWNEFFVDDPFADFDDDDVRGGFLEFSVPDTNSMVVDHVEVKLSISGDGAEFMNHARVLLVSPNGTHSELNQFWVEPNNPFSLQNISPATISGVPGSTFDGAGNFVWTFSTNRNWGERSDDAIVFDPTTGEPSGDVQGWRLFIENYDSTNAFGLAGLEMVWHGTPIAANTQRIQGLVGVDDDQNNDFNFSRVNLSVGDIDGDPNTLRFGEVSNIIDTSHESMASNVTVVVRRASDNVIVDQFVTGADGNYYFDLVPDDYIISVEDPLGRAAIEDTLSPSNILQHFRTEWTVTSDFFKVWEFDSNLEVAVDANGVPLPFNGVTTQYHVNNINFLLDPGPPVAPQVQFSGVVSADLNADGLFNGNDVNVPLVTVFADVNRNGVFDSGEQFTQTNATGQYNLTVPATIANVINIGIVKPGGWTFTTPATGVQPIFGKPGDVFTGIDFKMQPPLGVGAGNGTSQPGYLLGNIYEDVNNNGTRQASELGVPNTTVFIDVNNNGTREVGEPQTTTNVNGAYIFANVAPGIHRVRAIPTAPFMSINPGPGVPRVVTLAGGGTVSQIEFGIGLGTNPSGANFDFGDLPARYGITLLSENGARHARSAFFLGTSFDVDLDGQPSEAADGDDTTNLDDEDGIIVQPLVPGTTGSLVAIASRHGGNLQGWFDFNNNGVFEASEKVISNVALLPGPNDVTFQIPAGMALTDIFARFRYGEFGIDSVTGPALIGEVEDYLVPLAPGVVPAVIEHGPDFDEDGDVDGRDFLAWQRGFGITNGAAPSQGDANSDGKVNGLDLQQWRTDYGTTSAPLVVALTAGGDEDEDSANDFNTSDVDAELAVVLQPIVVPLSTSETQFSTEADVSTAPSQVVTYASSTRSSSVDVMTTEVSAQESTATRPSQRILSAVANEVERRFGSHNPIRPQVAARLEAHRIDQVFEKSSELAEIGLALRESNHHRPLAGLHRRFDFEQLQSQEDGSENAFDLALSEEILWRAI